MTLTGATLLALVVVVAVLAWEIHMAQLTLDDVLAKVTPLTDKLDSLIAFNAGLRQQVLDAAGDPAKIKAIFDAVDADVAKVDVALAANTTAAPPATPVTT